MNFDSCYTIVAFLHRAWDDCKDLPYSQEELAVSSSLFHSVPQNLY
jgi:hypothetical protein